MLAGMDTSHSSPAAPPAAPPAAASSAVPPAGAFSGPLTAAHLHQVLALVEAGQPEAAVASLRVILGQRPSPPAADGSESDPLYATARLYLAELLLNAAATAADVLAVEPLVRGLEGPNADFLRGMLGHRLGRLAEAAAAFSAVLAVAPDVAAAWNGLAACRQGLGQTAGALEAYQKACQLHPDFADAWANVATCHRERGDWLAAQKAFAHAGSLGGDNRSGQAFQQALCLPVIPQTVEEITAARQGLQEKLQAWEEHGPPPLADPFRQVHHTAFYLSYHRQDNRSLLQQLARCYRQACPSLDWTAPHCRNYRRPRQRLRVGYLSKYFYNHSIGRTSQGLICQHDRTAVEVVVLRLPPVRQDELSRHIAARADLLVDLPDDLFAARQRIADLQLDVLFYQDIGMEPLSYFLAFSRLAPVQCLSFGHPETTGIPAMDWFVSSALFEGAQADSHYSERLWQIPQAGTLAFYPPPRLQAAPELAAGTLLSPSRRAALRESLGLPAGRRLYVCPQALFKIDPLFDPLMTEILWRDPLAEIVLVSAGEPAWNDALRRRLQRAGPDVAHRFRFMPRLDGQKFLTLLAVADVVLDTPAFNGMNSSLESFAMLAPVVTLPGEFQRMRHTAGMYRRMGLQDSGAVVATTEDYVRQALALARDGDGLRTELAGRRQLLFDDLAVVRGFEAFFDQAVERVAGAG